MRAILRISGLLAIVVSGVGAEAYPSPGPREFLRGVVVSCPRSGQIWGSSAMDETLGELKGLGVEWVAIHPYGWIGKDGTVRGPRNPDQGYLERAAKMVDRAGVDLFWKPHLGYWGSFEWRGAIEFGEDDRAWKRFFEGYRHFIVEQARLAEKAAAPLFAVGVELDATAHREKEWREIVAAVRSVYSGEIVYASNWDRVEEIPFWDAVDLIGVHAYFPLAEDGNPSRAALASAWSVPLAMLEKLSRRHERPILVAEIGYNRSPRAAAEPWSYETIDSTASRRLRARLMDVAIERLEGSPHVAGMFWWKWMPGEANDPGDENFSMRDSEARTVLSRRWAQTAKITSQ